MNGRLQRGVHIVHHAAPLLRHACSLLLAVLVAVTALAHEWGHAAALRRAGAHEIVITIYGAGGSCRAAASDTSPQALFRYAAAGPIVTIGLVLAVLALRLILPEPHAARVFLWLLGAVMAGSLVFNVLPLLSRSDGGQMLRALTELFADRPVSPRIFAVALSLPAFSLLATLQGNALGAVLWSIVTVLLVKFVMRLVHDSTSGRCHAVCEDRVLLL